MDADHHQHSLQSNHHPIAAFLFGTAAAADWPVIQWPVSEWPNTVLLI